MVHRSADSRLLSNLISHEKEYIKQYHSLLDLSHASFNSLSAYAASSPPPASQVILAVASSLSNADNALRLYLAAVEEWTKSLQELKDLEDEVGNVMRDREILVTRLLKASKSTPKPSTNRDSTFIFTSPPESSSTLSLKSEDPSTTYASTSFFSALSPGPISASKKLQAAQAELQACETHLAKKEVDLDSKRSLAIRDGLRVRFRALAQCGWRWSEIGKEVEVLLGFGEQVVSSPQTSTKPLPELIAPVPVHAKPPTALEFNDRPSSDLSSIAPSQSASQIGVAVVGSPPPSNDPTAHIYSELEVASGPSPPSSESFHIPIPPAHSIDDLTLPTADSDATITRSTRRHVLPHRITEESLGFHEGILAGTRTSMDQTQEGGAESESDTEDEHLPTNARVVENPRFSAKNSKGVDANTRIGSTSSLSRANGVDIAKTDKDRTSIISASNSGKFFGSIRGLFGRGSKANDRRGGRDTSPSTTAAVVDDSGSIDEPQNRPRGRINKSRIGLLGGKNRRKGQAGIFNEDDEEGGSVMSSPPAPLRMPHTSSSGPPIAAAIPRGRTMSEAHTSTSTSAHASGSGNGNSGRRLKKNGPGVGLRGKTASNDLADGELKHRRRSASVDYGDLSVRSRNMPRPRSRAEEWVEGQQQEVMKVEDEDRNPGENGGERSKPAVAASADGQEGGGGATALTKKSSVKRSKSDNRRSLPSSLPASSSSKSASTTTLVLPTGSLSTSTSTSSTIKNTKINSTSTSLSRNSSIRSATSAPSGSHTTHDPRAAVTRAHTMSVTPSATPSAQSTTTKNDRRANSHNGHGSIAIGTGSTSLMSIVEDVAKANREAWGKAEESGSSATLKKSVGGTITPSGLLETLKAPRGINIEDLKEQMDRDIRENHNHAQTRVRSGSASIPASRTDHTPGPSTSVSAPLLAALPVINDHSHAENKPTPGHRPGQVVLPLRSALKNPSRTPSPMQPPTQPSPTQVAPQLKPSTGSAESNSPSGSQIGSAVSTAGSSGSARSGRNGMLAQHQPTRTASPLVNSIMVISHEQDVKGKEKETSQSIPSYDAVPSSISSRPISSSAKSDSGSDSSDGASISSYETGVEAFEDAVDDNDDETGQGTGQHMLSHQNNEIPPHQHADGSDISVSSASTETLTRAETRNTTTVNVTENSGTDLTESNTALNAMTDTTHATPPRRRKSVRVSLQPTYSVTPPAIEDEDEFRLEAQRNLSTNKSSESHNDGVTGQDIWADSSDEDVEYQQAKRLFSLSSALGRKSKSKSTTQR
ncbi:hypothetical protein EV361DRAFT_886251 [Lentinula raphanica]|nr:hypothetical protein F5880DRAFT_1577460 [Lentinula raphanica]KAJ3975903.1 hypothetical protein EV361DRAFT_886251 [Lentinula raphanica]